MFWKQFGLMEKCLEDTNVTKDELTSIPLEWFAVEENKPWNTQFNSQLKKLTRTRTESDRIKLAEQSLINLIQRRFLILSLTSTQTTWTAKSLFEDDKSFSLDIRTLSQDIPLVVEAARDD